MKRVPVVATIVVAAAIAAMVALGLWQLLDRLPGKEAYLAQLAANPSRPPIAFPRVADETLLFRRARAVCSPPATIRRAGAGAAGYRLIATCGASGGARAMQVQIGTTRDPLGEVAWAGGPVSGWIAHAPDARPLIATLADRKAPDLLLVADRPAPGLAPNAPPDPAGVPNNHLAYAVQWFLFALVAAIIYVAALRRGGGRSGAPGPAGNPKE